MIKNDVDTDTNGSVILSLSKYRAVLRRNPTAQPFDGLRVTGRANPVILEAGLQTLNKENGSVILSLSKYRAVLRQNSTAQPFDGLRVTGRANPVILKTGLQTLN